MISVLIPAYNWDVSGLVDDLIISADRFSGEVEIIICDDASPDQSKFEKISALTAENENVILFRNKMNKGRSATRNELVAHASYDNVVFIDGDSRIASPGEFLSNYAKVMKDYEIAVGGTHYDRQPPNDKNFGLHWKYGSIRESKTAQIRNQDPLRYFFSNNFYCRKSIFLAVPFDERIRGYGYEDSLWIREVVDKDHIFCHIENYVIHKGLNSNQKFLDNADEAVRTLAMWAKLKTPHSIRILSFFIRQKKSFGGRILLGLARVLRRSIRLVLERGLSRNLKLYDFYRLGSLTAISRE